MLGSVCECEFVCEHVYFSHMAFTCTLTAECKWMGSYFLSATLFGNQGGTWYYA